MNLVLTTWYLLRIEAVRPLVGFCTEGGETERELVVHLREIWTHRDRFCSKQKNYDRARVETLKGGISAKWQKGRLHVDFW